jgi:amino acid transporter
MEPVVGAEPALIADEPRSLRRNLSIWQVLGLSVGLMAPSMAANINPQGAIGVVGRAIPLTLVIATVGVLLVSYGFVRLTQHFHHAGSVYGFVGATLGSRAGAVSGWSLMGTYIAYGVVVSITGLLESTNTWAHPPSWFAYLVAAVVLVLAWALSIIPAKRGTTIVLSVEAVTVTLVLIVCVDVLIHLFGRSGPGHLPFTFSVFSLAKGTNFSSLGLGVVFGFLSFAGFEAACALGEEAKRPRRDIPRAVLGTALLGGIFYIVTSAVEVMGFGTSTKGLTSFAATNSLLGTLGATYLTSWVGDLITLGTIVSAFGCGLACTTGAARLSLSLIRDGSASEAPKAAYISRRWGTPVVTTTVITLTMAVIEVICKAAFAATPISAFEWSATVGTLVVLFVYMVVTAGAMRLLFFSGMNEVRRIEAIIPVAALLVLGYTIYRNVVPYPTGDDRWLPMLAGIWVLVAVAGVVASPSVARRIGAKLTASDGLRPAPEREPGTGSADPVRPIGAM